ncbi:MAG: DsbA family protein [Anaerolineales bacterium]|nr:DsbA family protein [Anaerolineales bacterium]
MNDLPSPSSQPNDTVVFKRSHFYMALVPAAFVLGLAVGFLFWGRGAQPAAAPQAAQAQPQTTQQNVRRYDVPVDDDPALGPANAKITIIEFSDYECPYCSRWHNEVFYQIRQEYGDQVRFVYRDFPLTSIHPNSQPAAEAANCAYEQKAFWEFHDLLFSDSELSEEIYLQYAQELKLDLEQFQSCLTSGKYAAEVNADLEYASNLGVRSTPTFFVNGIAVVGAQPYEVFKEVIDKELAGEIP